MKNYEQKKTELMINQNSCCKACEKPFIFGEKIELAHGLINSVSNKKLFGEKIIDHVLNLSATHSGACNSKMLINRATQPVKAQERVIDIILYEMLKDRSKARIDHKKAFENIGEYRGSNPDYQATYKKLLTFFNK